MEDDTTGLLIIRVSVDPGTPGSGRVQIRLTTDVSAGFQRTVVLGADEVLAAVREWLNDVLRQAEP